MATQIIELEDGVFIEAEYATSKVSSVSGEIQKRMDSIRPLLLRVVQPVAAAWNELSEQVVLKQVELEVGFGIETSGNFFVASTKGNVNLTVKLVLARKEDKPASAPASD
jgi:hypothetical protein